MAGVPSNLLSWIKTEVDFALKLVRDSIAKFSAAPDDAAVLKVCPSQLHQVSGALRIVGLTGATRFCEAIEGTFSAVIGARPTKSAVETVDRAVLALKDYVDELARGQSNVPLRLFPVYRELGTLQGKPELSEKDLFYPEVDLQAPPHLDPRVLSMDKMAPYVHEQRARFQRGLLALLRNQPDGLKDMQGALDALYQIAPQLPDPRALWWASIGLLDGLLKVTEADWVAAAKPLCNKIDIQMRELATGSNKGADLLLREVLYVIAKCKPLTPRLKEIRQFYQLDSLFPAEQPAAVVEFDMDWLQPALDDLRSRLEALKGVWVQYISGEPESAARLRELVASFKARAKDFGNKNLVKLLDAISVVTSRLPDPYPRTGQLMVIEMASAFLLVENVIENFTNAPADLDRQIVIMGGWLLDAAKGKSTGEPPPGLRADLSQQICALQLRAQVSKEILSNLQHVEQTLDAFARDPRKRDSLPRLKPYLRQIHGALFVLRFERAAEALKLCEELIAECARPDHARVTEDMDWIAEGLSSVGFFLDPCVHGRDPADQAIALFFDRFQKRVAPAAVPSSPAPEPAAPAPAVEEAPALSAESVPVVEPAASMEPASAPADAPAPDAAVLQPEGNAELLAIFLEEAGEVLVSINTALETCRQQPENLDELTTIRRGFHTLKGSGRMVGLMSLGEVAWEIEQVMNRRLETKEPATPALLELISTASASFAAWVGQLRENKPLALHAQHIVELARRLKAGEEPAAAPAPAPEPAPVEPAEPALAATADPAPPAPEPEEVEIGGTRLARSFFEIYTKEAAQHVAALESEYAAWRKTPGAEASHGFLRAAHTLASSSRTAGFTDIAELAGAIEHWLPFARQATQEGDAKAVQAAIGRLREMADAIAQRKAPKAARKEARRLDELTARLQATPPPPLETMPQRAAAPAALVAPKSPPPLPAAAPAAKGKERRTMRDDIDDQLLPIFLEEAQELLPQIGSDLRDLKANPADQKVSQSLMRVLHTFKGSARMAGAIRLGELTHIMESRIEAAVVANRFPAELFEDLESKMDRMSLDLERMRAGEPAAVAPAEQPAAAAPAGEAPREAPARVEPPLAGTAAMLRVNADTLDHLINESGEVSIARSRIEAELRSVKQALSDLNDSISRLRNQLREVEIQAESQMQSRALVSEEKNREFDPLEFDRYTRLQELTRMMAESLHDATSIQQALLKNVGETDAALLAQARTSRDVQQELMRMRAVPFSNLDERLYRIVRQVARELDKKAELVVEGSEVEIDRSVIEKIAAPLEHMLRNALTHGLEIPARRVADGKPESGRITITLRQESNEIALILGDDGAGLDLEKLHRKALEKGIMERGTKPSEAELTQLVFASGISTAEAVTELSGRGVGMDVVRNEITGIGGRIDIATTRGKGTTFTVYLPLTLAVTQAVLVRSGARVYAISSAMVEQVQRHKADALAELYEKGSIEARNYSYPLHYIQHLLGVAAATGVQNYNSVLLLRSGIQRIALHVDELVGNQEIVVKNIGPQLARVPGVAGATMLADGQIALIINPVQLAQRARAAAVRPSAPEPAVARPEVPVIMVVDDSLTVRKITSRLLEREGYQVLTAKDGVDALEQVRGTLPDVMLVDIEMPRMDGFELTKNLRADPRTHGIPIVFITSRTADKHRDQAERLGVNGFLGKPYQESDLLDRVSALLPESKRQALVH
jgi:chemosensory pili system protein ChpA (sensor histidine kinase/response regulator)